LNSWKGLNEVTISLEELHSLLATPPSFRKNFKEFRTRVLEIAQREITDPQKTALFFEWQPVKKGLQKVVAIKFIFNPALVKTQETPEEQAKRELAEAQHLAESCWQTYQTVNKKCKPGKRSKKCQFCTTRGRVWAHDFMKQAQGNLPFDNPLTTSAAENAP
jgi:plasmid replication initiation protein